MHADQLRVTLAIVLFIVISWTSVNAYALLKQYAHPEQYERSAFVVRYALAITHIIMLMLIYRAFFSALVCTYYGAN